MKIIILGAGQVGTTLAESLCDEHDVTIIDLDSTKLAQLQRRLDLRTITGHASYPHILEEAGADDADMLIAVTSNDETNIVACQISYSLFRTPTKIARVRAPELTANEKVFTADHIPIDMLINPSNLITQRIKRQIQNPGTQLVVGFADEKVLLASVRATPPSPMIGKKIHDLYQDLEDIQVNIVGILRDDKMLIAEPEHYIEPHDELYFAARAQDIRKITQSFHQKEQKFRRIMLAGAGNIGLALAKEIEGDYNVKLLDRNPKSCEKAASELNQTVVLNGDVGDVDLLQSENIDEIDFFCALTNDDEANIMSAILAKRFGAKITACLVNRQTYAHYLIERTPDIDVAISPQRITGGDILKHLRKGDMVNVYPLPHNTAEAIEIIVHGEEGHSKVVGHTVEGLDLPSSIRACAIVREEEVIIQLDDVILQTDDHVVFFVSNHNHIKEIEKRFQVAPSFI